MKEQASERTRSCGACDSVKGEGGREGEQEAVELTAKLEQACTLSLSPLETERGIAMRAAMGISQGKERTGESAAGNSIPRNDSGDAGRGECRCCCCCDRVARAALQHTSCSPAVVHSLLSLAQSCCNSGRRGEAAAGAVTDESCRRKNGDVKEIQ